MARALDVSILVRLVDRVTAPLRTLQRGLERLGALASRIGVLGGAIAAISFMTPIHQAAAFEQKLRDLVVTAGQFGEAAETRIKAVKGELFDLTLQVGVVADQLAEALAVLTASGMNDALANRLLPTIGRVSKAASAVPNDVARVVFALSNTFKISIDQMELALGKLVTAGKLGRFEFKDMAKAIPELSSALEVIGVSGMEAVSTMGAALQVAMFGTDSASTAANNFKNFLQKVLAPDALKNFKEMGVDIQRVMTDALAKGINPVEAALEKITKLTGTSEKELNAVFKRSKGKGQTDAQAAEEVKKHIRSVMGRTKLSELFADTQVLDFLVPFTINKDKYRDFKEAINAAGLDEMARDFQTQMAGLSTQLTIFGQILDIFKDRVGMAFGRNLPWINAGLTSLLDGVKRLDAAFPGLVDHLLTFGGGALVLVTALGLLGPVFSILAAGAGVVATAIGVILSPIGLVVAAIAAAAVLIITHWEPVKGFFLGMWTEVTDAFARAGEAISGPFTDALSAVVDGTKALFAGDWSGALAGGEALLAGLGRLGSGIWAVMGDLGGRLRDWAVARMPGWMRTGVAAASTAFKGLADIGRGVIGAVGALFRGDWSGFAAGAQQVLASARSWIANLGVMFSALGRVVADWAISMLPASLQAGARKAVAVVGETLSGIVRIASGIGTMLTSAVTTIFGRLSGAAEWLWSVISAGAERLRAAVETVLTWLGGSGPAAFDAVADAAAKAWNAIKAKALEWGQAVVDAFQALASMSDDDWRALGERLGNAVMDGAAALIEWITSLPGRMGAHLGEGAAVLRDAGADLVQRLWDGAKSKFAELQVWFAGLPGRIKSAIGSIDLSGLFKMPSLPPWMGGGSAPANDNATGGVTTPPSSEDPAATPPPVSGRPPDPPHQKQGWAPTPGRKMADAGFAPPPALSRGASTAPANAPQEVAVGGRIVVEAAPGTSVREAQSDDRRIALVSGRGPVIGRP